MKKWMCFVLIVMLCCAGFSFVAAQAATGTICNTCNGTGKTACTWCGGTGLMEVAGMRYACSSCGGTGTMDCLGRCGGDGIIENNNSYSGGSQATGSICETCGGTGKSACSWCGAMGVMEIGGIRYVCSGCGGSGAMACLGKCGGDGVIEAPGTGGNLYFVPDNSIIHGNNSTCVICKGTGQKICPSCNGSGSLSKAVYGSNFGFGSSNYSMNSRCYACNGSGKVICTYCFGG